MRNTYAFLFLFFVLACNKDEVAPTQSIVINEKFLKNEAQVLEKGFAELRTLPYMGSMIVIKNGEIIKEEYFNKYNQNYGFNIKSSSKGFISVLIGIAIEQGYIKSVDEKISQFFPEYIDNNSDPRKFDVTIKHLLTMQSGFDSDEADYSTYFTQNWVESILKIEMGTKPGTKFIYDSKMTHLLSAILTKSTGKSTLEFAEKYLFQPLNIKIKGWSQSPVGIYEGGSEMYFTSRDLSKLGLLYLNNGMFDEKQIINEAWVKESLINRTNVNLSNFGREVTGYGYSWWLETIKGEKAFSAKGVCGQFVTVFPELDLVVTTTTDWKYVASHNLDTSAPFINKFIAKYIIP